MTRKLLDATAIAARMTGNTLAQTVYNARSFVHDSIASLNRNSRTVMRRAY